MYQLRNLLLLSFFLTSAACSPKWIELVPNEACKQALKALETPAHKGCMVFRQKSDLVWILEYKDARILYCLDDNSCDSEDIKMPPPQGEQEEAILLFPPSEKIPASTPRREVAAACNAVLGRQTPPGCWNEVGSPPDTKRCWTFLRIKPNVERDRAQCTMLSTTP